MTRRLVSLSITPFAAELLAGSPEQGTAIGAGYVLFGKRVLAVTRPGALRMPNGIETDILLRPGEPVAVGGGELRTAAVAIRPGPVWDPRPSPRVGLSVWPHVRLRPELLVGRGPGLTPLGDDILVGYLAGNALAGMDEAVTALQGERAAGRTTALSLTLLRLAALGQLPEAAHRLLEEGDPEPLLRFGATSGRGIAIGLGLARGDRTGHGRSIVLALPPPAPSSRFELTVIQPLEEAA
jgi:hypothetical protein